MDSIDRKCFQQKKSGFFPFMCVCVFMTVCKGIHKYVCAPAYGGQGSPWQVAPQVPSTGSLICLKVIN